MTRSLAFIASNDNLYYSKLTLDFLKDSGRFQIQKINNYYDAEKNLSEKKFDLIFLRPDYLNWKEFTKENEIENQKPTFYKEYVGRKILTDIIRKKNSVNYNTPVYVEILGGLGRGENYSRNAYLSLGATHIFKNFANPEEILELFNSQLKK